MARIAGKMRGDMRAMEEQMERHNPINPKSELRVDRRQKMGGSATPSMGLSQFRGGMRGCGESECGEEMEGGGPIGDMIGMFNPTLGPIASMMGLGHGDMSRAVGAGRRRRKGEATQMEGGGPLGSMIGLVNPMLGPLASMIGLGRKKKGMSEATQMGLRLGKHLHSLHGAGFWGDFGRGFMSVIRPAAGIAKTVLPFLGPEGMVASAALGAVGLGSARRGARGRPRKGALQITHGGASNSDTGAYEGRGRESDDVAMMRPAVMRPEDYARYYPRQAAERRRFMEEFQAKAQAQAQEKNVNGGSLASIFTKIQGLDKGIREVLDPKTGLPARLTPEVKTILKDAYDTMTKKTGGANMSGGFSVSDLLKYVTPENAKLASFALKGLTKGSGRRRAPAGPNDGRRARAEIVRRVMAERGIGMIQASKAVKAEGLY